MEADQIIDRRRLKRKLVFWRVVGLLALVAGLLVAALLLAAWLIATLVEPPARRAIVAASRRLRRPVLSRRRPA